MIQGNYGIKIKPITFRNPQANSILERFHQTIGNTKYAQDLVFDDEKLWDGFLASTMFALHTTVHSTTQHATAQSVFVSDSILNTLHKAYWQ